MTTDTRTTNQNYPKPYPSNLLAADVIRLRDALDAIDGDIADRPTLAAVQGLVDTAVQQLLDGAPAAMDTLKELSQALADDSNFASTVTADLATKLNLAGGTLTGALTLSGNPTQPFEAATKVFVETEAQAVADLEKAWQIKTADYTAQVGDRLFLDSSGGAFTVTLPANPSQGDFVQLADGASFATNIVTIDRNGSNIVGAADDLEMDVDNASIRLVYTDATSGWRLA